MMTTVPPPRPTAVHASYWSLAGHVAARPNAAPLAARVRRSSPINGRNNHEDQPRGRGKDADSTLQPGRLTSGTQPTVAKSP